MGASSPGLTIPNHKNTLWSLQKHPGHGQIWVPQNSNCGKLPREVGDSPKVLQLGEEEGFVPLERGFAVSSRQEHRLCLLSCDNDTNVAWKRGIHGVKAALRPSGWACRGDAQPGGRRGTQHIPELPTALPSLSASPKIPAGFVWPEIWPLTQGLRWTNPAGNLTDMGLLVMFPAVPASGLASAKSEEILAELRHWCSQRETKSSELN